MQPKMGRNDFKFIALISYFFKGYQFSDFKLRSSMTMGKNGLLDANLFCVNSKLSQKESYSS